MMRQAIIAMGLAVVAASPAAAQSLVGPGRYSMAPAAGGGFARLDTETGHMSICQPSGSDWTCRDMDDDSRKLRQEYDRLVIENRQLREDNRRLGEADAGAKRLPKEPKADQPGGRFTFPSEQDLDNAFSQVERLLRKFRDKLKDLDDGRGTRQL